MTDVTIYSVTNEDYTNTAIVGDEDIEKLMKAGFIIKSCIKLEDGMNRITFYDPDEIKIESGVRR